MTSRKNLPIPDWDNKDKPREKMLEQGRDVLSDAELIAILMGSGNTEKTAVELAKEILAEAGNSLDKLAGFSVTDLMRFKGVGEAKAVSIAAAMELGLRRKFETKEKTKITCSRDIFNHVYPLFDKKPHEEFWIILLDRANQVIFRRRISSGSLSGSLADPKLIFKTAVDHYASSLILVHNHPSGNIEPSASDIKLTKKVKAAGEVLDIAVLDHLIIGEAKYFSFADENMM